MLFAGKCHAVVPSMVLLGIVLFVVYLLLSDDFETHSQPSQRITLPYNIKIF